MVWVRPEEVTLTNALWDTERADGYFILQKRKGYGTKGLSSILVGTIDSVLDTRPAPYRIMFQTPNSEISYTIAASVTHADILSNWSWLNKNLKPILASFDDISEATNYVKCKIESLYAQSISQHQANVSDGHLPVESFEFRSMSQKFIKLFDLANDEKLVNYYMCSYWIKRIPYQGVMYLSVNYLAFYSKFLSKETKILLKWHDITLIERTNPLIFTQTIVLSTKHQTHEFSMFSKPSETYNLIEQLANLAMKQIMNNQDFDLSPAASIIKPNLTSFDPESAKQPKANSPQLKRELDARALSETYRRIFRLPSKQRLDGSISCTLFAPYSKKSVWGKLYLFDDYICFASKANVSISAVI